MKRIFAVFAMLLSVNVFACQGVVHETLEEAKALHKHGYQQEARALFDDLVYESGIYFSPHEIVSIGLHDHYCCYRSKFIYRCTSCGFLHSYRPYKCRNRAIKCDGTSFEIMRTK